MQMFGPAVDAFKIFGKSVRLGILFEVVDDPEDQSDYFGHIKPVDVWLFASKAQLSPEQSSLASIQKSGTCIRNITKVTPAELRTHSITAIEDGFLYVHAVPTPEWAGLYAHRQYAVVPVKTGRSYNFAVSLPAKLSSKASLGSAIGWKGKLE
jgi:hypothetical protein